jgi:pimeloyl-ACP methyl ester carboxylesterase
VASWRDFRCEGTPLVLLHSLLAGAGSWVPLADRLAGSARLFVPDLPVFRGSNSVSGGHGAIAAAVAETIRARLPAGPIAVIGNGFGSFVAEAFANASRVAFGARTRTTFCNPRSIHAPTRF